ncbi:MAG TPA: zinc-binding dehydrogenase [Saprospiraceae bacterium]|nr:zinc-binding dehydrogenase [Saprospiraceae bacterium]
MKALVLNTLHQGLDYQEMPAPHAGKQEALVHVRAAALNHRDLFITQGLYAGIKFPTILGSDGAGEYRGKAVVIDPSLDWGNDPSAQGRSFKVLGMPDDGTFAAQIAVVRSNVHPKPEHLNWEQAAALPLAGVTAWRALFTRCQLKAGERVLITGIGGGVALTALQMAVAAGAEVFVSSGSDEKIAKAVALGAKGGANYRLADWDKTLKKDAGGFDVVIDSAGGDGFGALLGLCNPGARIGVYGGTLGKINGLSPQPLFWKQVSILGSTMGTRLDFRRMLAFVSKHEIVPVIDSVFALSDGNEALKKMERGDQFGKIVLRIA